MASSLDMEKLEFFARCAGGFEGTLTRELRSLGIRGVRPLTGGVSFSGVYGDALWVCLKSRVATRVQLVLARVGARDADELYAGVYSVTWEEHVPLGATVAVWSHGTNAQLRNTQFTSVRVKDALCDRLREVRGERPNVDARNPDFALDVALHKDKATLCLNLSGESLHRRGYRAPGEQSAAPLKETLAAGMLMAAGWDTLLEGGETVGLIDPMCGSGTLAIEAALMAADVAPGLLREHWGFEGWLQHDAAVWERVRVEARKRRAADVGARTVVVAGDIDASALELARANAKRAGVDGLVEFRVADATALTDYAHNLPEQGLLVCNPPYGVRLQEASELPRTYAALATALEAVPSGWRAAIISPDAGISSALGMTPRFELPCHNGPIEACIRVYDVAAENRQTVEVISLSGVTREVPVAERTSEQFAARLRKVARERVRWARKQGVDCYRLYDADLPDYALAIDLFECTGMRYLRIEEHPAPASIDAARASRRLADAVSLAAAILDVSRDNVCLARRAGEGQPRIIAACEDSLTFEVDLTAPHDTGLALDLRVLRTELATRAKGAHVLCIPSQAGVPACVAAAAGAVSTTTVDTSETYLKWAKRNLEANGQATKRNRLVHAEPLAWLRANDAAFDLAFAELPPTQEDTDALIAELPKGTTAILISHSRRVTAPAKATELTPSTLPHDFERTPRIHRAWLLEC